MASLSRIEVETDPVLRLYLDPLHPRTRLPRQCPQRHRVQHQDSGGAGATSGAAFTRRLKVPLNKNQGGYASIYLVTGEITASGAGADDIYYQKNDSGQLELRFNTATAILADRNSSIGKEECTQAIATSPTAEPLRRLAKGTLICATGRDGGVALLQILEQPDQSGTLPLMETYWAP